MSNISKLEFAALDVDGKNYMPWSVNVEMYLESMGILDALQENNTCSSIDRAKANVFLHKHLDSALELEFFNIRSASTLWNDLKERFDHQRDVLLPAARHEWNTIRFQDFPKVNQYSSALFRIRARLRFCGQNVTEEEMLEKTYSTFHASNINLQQQYRLMKFKRYSDLNSCLLVAEQNNELLMKNHQTRPTGSVALPEVNATQNGGFKSNTRGRGRGRGRGRFGQNHSFGHNHFSDRNHNLGRGHSYGRGRGRGRGRSQRNNTYYAPRGNKTQPQNKTTKHDGEASTSQNLEGSCFRCGSTDHWSRACRTPSHLCKLYQASLKEKEKEVNFVEQPDYENTELNATDFCDDINNML